MGKKDPRVDAYIAQAPDFARPILNHIRQLMHAACPEVEETLKWNCPHFEHHGLLGGMAAFKQHCTLNFWKGALIFAGRKNDSAWGQFGRIESLSDLPRDAELKRCVKEAMRLNEEGVKVAKPKTARKELTVPADLVAALKKKPRAQAAFDQFSYSHKKEYVEWITEAKRDETRARRVATTVQWLTEGKSRDWKYANC